MNGRTHQDRTRTKTDGANVKALDLVYLSCEIVRVALRLWKTRFIYTRVGVDSFFFLSNVCVFGRVFFAVNFTPDMHVHVCVSAPDRFEATAPSLSYAVSGGDPFGKREISQMYARDKKEKRPQRPAFRTQRRAFLRNRKKLRNVITRSTIRLHWKSVRRGGESLAFRKRPRVDRVPEDGPRRVRH